MFNSSVPATGFGECQQLHPNGATSQASTGGPRQYTAFEWQSKRFLIKHLYIDLDKTLIQVMEILSQEHDFHATRKMYKSHLAAWGFAKNYTEKRVRSLLHQKRERDAVGKVSKFGDEGGKVDFQRIAGYLKRKKGVKGYVLMDGDKIVRDDVKISSPSASKVLRDQDPHPNLAPSQPPLPPQPPASSYYEQNCPYRPWPNKFRLIEKFPNGSSYKGDSFGYHSYISVDEERACTLHCLCRQHRVPESFTFIVNKTLVTMEITFFSDGLYSQLIDILGLENLQVEVEDQQRTINGLVLLKHYRILKNTLSLLLHSERPPYTTTRSLVLEMELLVCGLLADGEVFKSFGYEDLYERKFLDFELWREFQQEKLERDISALEESFYAIDDDLEELQIPPVDQNSLRLQSTQTESFVDVIDAPDDFRELPASLVQANPNHIDLRPTDVEPTLNGLYSFKELSGSAGLQPTEYEPADTTQLVFAAIEGHEDVVQLLLDQGAAVDGTSLWDSPLTEAAKAGHEGVVQLLLDWGAAVDGKWRDSPLAIAAKAGHESVVRLLLDQTAAVDSKNGIPPLAIAAKAGHKGVVQLLLDWGAAVDGKNGNSPLAEAANAGHESVVRLLLDQGAAVDGKWRNSPLAEAAKVGHEGIVLLLLDRGAAVDGKNGNSPLAKAAEAGHEGLVLLLLDKGAAVDGKWRNYPLAKAAKAGHEAVAGLLLGRGAAVVGKDGNSLSAEAANVGHEELVRLLLDRGAALDGKWGDSPLAEAAKAGHESVVRLLLERGAAVGKIPMWGFSQLAEVAMAENFSDRLLIAAASCGHMPIVRLLLKYGADTNAVTLHGSALSAAATAGHENIVRLLLRHGADVQTAAVILGGLSYTGLAMKRLFKAASQVRNGITSRPHHYNVEKVRKVRYLHRKFSDQHILMLKATQSSSTEFRGLGQRFRYLQEAWAAGIRTMRELCGGESPGNFGDTIAFLCLARAISETLAADSYDYNEQFLQDLGRWQVLFTSKETDFRAYRDAVQSMWNTTLAKPASTQGQDEALLRFQALASTLINLASESLGFSALSDTGLESSQRRWHSRNSQIISNTDLCDEISDLHFAGASGAQFSEVVHPQPPDPAICSDGSSLMEQIENDISSTSIDTTVILLMAGAIFAIVIIFLQWLRNISAPAYGSSIADGINTLQERCRNLETYMDLKKHMAVFQANPISLAGEMAPFNDFGFFGYS